MAHRVEPMDIDSDFDNKENTLHHSNVLPFTEKGYEELDVSELNVKLRYSVTPVSSPMSKSYTAHCPDNRTPDSGDDSLDISINGNTNLTRSLNSTITLNDNVVKPFKVLPLQTIQTEQFVDCNRSSVLRSLEPNLILGNTNINITVTNPIDAEDNLSLPSTVSSAVQTPEATTPTKDIPPKDGGSPIMRGLKSVLNMFRSSQSPIPPSENDILPPSSVHNTDDSPVSRPEDVMASTPIQANRKKEMSPTKRISPHKDNSVVFNQDLEKELTWKDETTIFFSEERIPIHKLFPPQPQFIKAELQSGTDVSQHDNPGLDSTTEYMDISYNDSIKDTTMTDVENNSKKVDNTLAGDSDNEFVDCETTFTKSEPEVIGDTTLFVEYQDLDVSELVQGENNSGSKLRPIILDTTQDILDATLSIRPEDLLPESRNKVIDNSLDPYKIGNLENCNRNRESQETTTPVIDSSPQSHAVDTTNALANNKDVYDIKAIEVIPKKEQNNSFNLPCETQTDSHVENILEETLTASVPEDKTEINEDISLNSKTFEVQNSSLTSESTQVLKPDEEHNNILPAFVDVDESKILPCLILNSQDEVKSLQNVPFSELNNLEISAAEDETLYQLPAEIPLPDENDVEKELLYLHTTENSAPVSLDLNTDDTLTTTPIEDTKVTGEEDNKIENEVDKIVLEKCIPKSTEINNEIIDLNNDIETQNLDKDDSKETKHVIGKHIQTESISVIKPLPDIVNKISTATNMDNIAIRSQDLESTMTSNNLSGMLDSKLENSINLPISPVVSEIIPKCVNNSFTDSMPVAKIEEQGSTVVSTVDPINDDSLVCDNHSEITTRREVDETTLSDPLMENVNIKEVDEELILSENNSPFVSVRVANTPGNLNTVVENSNTLNVSIEKDKVLVTPPISPPIQSKGYNFNFDDGNKTENLETATEHSHAIDASLVKDNVDVTQSNSPVADSEETNLNPEVDNIPVNIELQNVVDNPISGNELASTPPNSPPIKSKGYNFNFDDMDFDPFATKTNIRMSPPINDTPGKQDVHKTETKHLDKCKLKKNLNRRKSESAKKRTNAPKRKSNTPAEESIKSIENLEQIPGADIQLDLPATVCMSPKNVTIEDQDIKVHDSSNILHDTVIISNEISEAQSQIVNEEAAQTQLEFSNEVNNSASNINVNEFQTASSSEQSTYFSAGTSSSDSCISRNVFNLPEIDDRNFNPFATKTKMCQSPPPSLDLCHSVPTESIVGTSSDRSIAELEQHEEKLAVSEEKIETELMEKDTSGNLSNTTASSKTTDERNSTTREVHTEDEDTIEGPFLEGHEENLVYEHRETSDFLGESSDMMQFNELPTRNHEENIDSKEMFIDAEAFEFLLNQNKCNTVADSGKESLFLKFDPLFAKKMSTVAADSVAALLPKIQRQSMSTMEIQSPSQFTSTAAAGSSNMNITQDIDMNISDDFHDSLNITVSKPMMVVPPAINPVTPKNKPMTPSQSNRRSITLTSPAMAVIDRLLSLSFNNSPAQNINAYAGREQNEADAALSQLRELLADKEVNVFNLRSESKELRNRLNILESHLKVLETENQEKLKRINLLNESLIEKTKINKNMATVVEEYERTIASLIAETAQDKKKHEEERVKLINERDEQTAHLSSMEVSFSDLHSKYEKSKQVILHCKANEDVLKKSIKDFEENLAKMQNNYELLKQHATSKLNHANQELEKMNKSHEAEVLKFNAMIKRKDLHITSLEESLIQKTKANEELTAICDDLINRVG